MLLLEEQFGKLRTWTSGKKLRGSVTAPPCLLDPTTGMLNRLATAAGPALLIALPP